MTLKILPTPKNITGELGRPKMEYLAIYPRHLPEDGRVIIHNHIRPHLILGRNGFRAWLDELDPNLHTECDCSWSKLKHYQITALTKLSKT